MNSSELKKKYVKFFEKKNHTAIACASLIPENDPSVLFTTAGMHPLVPFLMGEPHPKGNRLTNYQKCIRTGDIDEVGDDFHLTFFEMLGNWSMGDYFKKEAITLSYEFLTKELGLPVEKLAFTCFAGDKDAPRDEESANIWKSLGVSSDKIAFLPKKDNWWGPASITGPCGPDTEMFYLVGKEKAPAKFDPKDSRWVELWNDVFMQYNKTKEGKHDPLKQRNVDTGMGVERVAMVLQGKTTVYEIETLKPIYDLIKKSADKEMAEQKEKSIRIITDHLRASTFILGDERGVVPSNVDQGYILRRFIRRSIRHMYLLKISEENITKTITATANKVVELFSKDYPELKQKQAFIIKEFERESEKFNKTIEKGMNEIKKKMKSVMIQERQKNKEEFDYKKIDEYLLEWQEKEKELELNSKWIFDLFQSVGMPPEMTLEEVQDAYNATITNKETAMKEFEKLFAEHQKKSRAGAEKRFKGGLADASEMSKKLHTATHLLNEALRQVLSKDITQKGSNITAERLRFDFNFDRKLTDDEKKKIEDLINKKIAEKLPVTKEKMPLQKALKSGAQSEFGTRYPDEVWVYSVGDFSKEICMGPHVKNTSELGHFKIKKEESSSAGIRRIKAVLN